MIALAGLMFAGVQSATAQMDYSVNIEWGRKPPPIAFV